MSKGMDVIALGELLIDFTMNGMSSQGNQLFEANPGGAPCNVLAMLNKLGKKTAFIGKVGQDQFGKLLKNTLDEIQIDTSHLYMDETVRDSRLGPTDLVHLGYAMAYDLDYLITTDKTLRKYKVPSSFKLRVMHPQDMDDIFK